MLYCVKPGMISKIDAYAASECNLSAAEQMRRASAAIASEIKKRIPEGGSVLFLCGSGNNGGDGYGAARIMAEEGYDVTALDVFGRGQRSDAGREMLESYRLTGEVCEFDDFFGGGIDPDCFSCYDAVVEAIFGTGFSGELPEEVTELIFALNATDSCVRFAIDAPAGIDGETGEVRGAALRADVTLAISFFKIGELSYPARDYCGELVLCDIGMSTPEIIGHFALSDFTPDDCYVADILPRRARSSHKGSYGKLLALCGSPAFRGAAYLASAGALSVGCGIVNVASCECVISALASRLPEPVYLPIPPVCDCIEGDISRIMRAAAESDAVLVGCGCSRSENLLTIVTSLLATPGAPLILDADALNVLADTGDECRTILSSARRRVVITPHPAEFARLCGSNAAAVQASRLRFAVDMAEESGVVCVLKGAGTVIAMPDSSVAVCRSGSPALAKGGSGDVLAGVIAGLCAQGIEPESAAVVGTYIHGLAGEALARTYSEYGVMPHMLPQEISRQILRCTGR